MPKLEVACFNLESVQIACEARADRIELCIDAHMGGTTPGLELCKQAYFHARSRQIPVHVMIRPRGGDFVYTDVEYEAMCLDLSERLPYADGFVFGLLTADGMIDEDRTKALVRRASPAACTFHRAFDHAHNRESAHNAVLATGCTAILTSGGMGPAASNLVDLQRLKSMEPGGLEVLVGGSVRSSNIVQINRAVKAHWYHTSGILHDSTADYNELITMLAVLSKDLVT